MAPSTLGLVHNVRAFVAAQVADLLGVGFLGTLAGWSVPGLAICLLAGISVVASSWRAWPSFTPAQQRAFILAAGYALLGAAVVIAARTRYEWGDGITVRNTLQYVPFLLLLLALLFARVFRDRPAHVGLSVIVLLLVAVRLASILDDVRSVTGAETAIIELIADDGRQQVGGCERNDEQLIVSNFAYLYRILCDANARHLGSEAAALRTPSALAAAAETELGDRRLYLVVHPGPGIDASAFPLPDTEVVALENKGWSVERNGPLTFAAMR
jgi:hypothetical protein